jgi:uncharacterized damage-inducible protein DinB
MPHTCCESFRRWFEAEKDAHAKTLRSLESVPADRRASPEFQKALSIMGHLAYARRAWITRIEGAAPLSGPTFPQGVELAALPGDFQTVHDQWTRYLATLNDAELDRMIEFQHPTAGHVRHPVHDILAQLFTHSAYHRGQIASLVRVCGGEPAATDFILWCREQAAKA